MKLVNIIHAIPESLRKENPLKNCKETEIWYILLSDNKFNKAFVKIIQQYLGTILKIDSKIVHKISFCNLLTVVMIFNYTISYYMPLQDGDAAILEALGFHMRKLLVTELNKIKNMKHSLQACTHHKYI